MSRTPIQLNFTEKEIEELKLSLKAALKHKDARYRRRLQVIWFCYEGLSLQEISAYLKMSRKNIWKWRRVYKEKGLEGLRRKYEDN